MSMSKRSLKSWLLAGSLLAAMAAPIPAQQLPNAAPKNTSVQGFKPVTDAMLLKPDPADWLMWRRTYDAGGYSPLDQINKSNVKNLQVAGTWSLTPRATETPPHQGDGAGYAVRGALRRPALSAAPRDLHGRPGP